MPDSVVRLQLVGANPSAAVAGEAELPGKANYFIGNDPKQWRTNVPTYGRVKYQGLYPGVDLVYYGNQGGQLEYDFVVAPRADPSSILLAIDGAGRVGSKQKAVSSGQSRIDSNGDLVVHMNGNDEVRFHKPVVYQEEESGARQGIRSSTAVNRQSSIDNRQLREAASSSTPRIASTSPWVPTTARGPWSSIPCCFILPTWPAVLELVALASLSTPRAALT